MDKEKLDKLVDMLKEFKIDLSKEIDLSLISNGPEPRLEVEQIDMPDDWIKRLSNAKVEHDKHGNVALVLVLPLSWLDSFKSKVKNGDDKDINKFYDKDANLFWGADIMFGVVDDPIASGRWL